MRKYANINEIDEKYVSTDCAQLMIPFNKSLSIFGEKEMCFYGRLYGENTIDNKHYIQDERKKQFPYNDIPYHWTRKNLLSKVLYVNQLFDFKKPYVLIRDGILSECFITKIEDKTYIVQTDFAFPNKCEIVKKYIKKERLYDYFGELIENDDGKKTYIIDSTGKQLNICFDKNERKQKRKEIIDFLKAKKLLIDYDENNIYYTKGKYLLEDNFMLQADEPLYMIKLDNGVIKTKYIKIFTVDDEAYKVVSCDIPVEKYDLEEIRKMVKGSTDKLKEPVFSKRLIKQKNI